jgi:serine/threonine-protein kinase
MKAKTGWQRQGLIFGFLVLFSSGPWLSPRAVAEGPARPRGAASEPVRKGVRPPESKGSGPFSHRLSGVLAQWNPNMGQQNYDFDFGHKKEPTGPNWLLIGGIGFGVVLLLGLALVLFSGEKKGQKRRVGGVKVSETQIDDYRLMNLMMTGQTSQVWEVAELASGRHFALKMLLPEHVKSAEQRFFLFHEGEVGRQIVHPKIIKMLTLIKDSKHPYLIMEFFPSTNLKLRIMHKEPFIKENLQGIIEQAATGLAFMHERGWVHRDVKPDNILVNSAADVRLIDFALAQRISKKGLFKRRSGKAQGTRSYMSPEQIRGEPLDQRADIYSFGITIYELLTFRPPFRASNPQDLLQKQILEKPAPPQLYNPEISDDLADLVMRMLSKKREDRPPDFHAFLMKFRGMRLFKAPAAKKKA